MANYVVWVGGAEVNDYFLSQEQANAIAELFKTEGYEAIVVEVSSQDEEY